MKLLVIAPYPPDQVPSQRYRFEQYLPRLRRDGVTVDVRPLMDETAYRAFHRPGHVAGKAATLLRGLRRRISDLSDARGHDVVLVHREAFPVGGAVLEGALARRGPPIVYDFDDALFLRDMSPANRWAGVFKRPGKIRRILARSRVVLAGNDHLAEYARRFADDVRVLPTVIDTERYRPIEPRPCVEGVRIVWTGSPTTVRHLRLLEPALARLQAEEGVRVRVIGAESPFRSVETEVVPWRSDTEVEDLEPGDVGVMPLPDTDWERGKCGLKLLQYMGMGMAAVASPVGVNRTIIADGENGLLAATDAEWLDALRALVLDPDLRARLGRAARTTVESRYSVDATYPAFLGALADAARGRA